MCAHSAVIISPYYARFSYGQTAVPEPQSTSEEMVVSGGDLGRTRSTGPCANIKKESINTSRLKRDKGEPTLNGKKKLSFSKAKENKARG